MKKSYRTVNVPYWYENFTKTLDKMSVRLSTKTIISTVSLITHNAVYNILKKFCIENKMNK